MSVLKLGLLSRIAALSCSGATSKCESRQGYVMFTSFMLHETVGRCKMTLQKGNRQRMGEKGGEKDTAPGNQECEEKEIKQRGKEKAKLKHLQLMESSC